MAVIKRKMKRINSEKLCGGWGWGGLCNACNGEPEVCFFFGLKFITKYF